jgi:hypothetical protein
MAISREYTIEPDGQRIGLTLPDFGYSDVFSENFSYPGSAFQIQEIATILLDVSDPKGIDVNMKWFIPNRYVGSWQILRDTGVVVGDRRVYAYGGTDEQAYQGRITEYEFKLSRTSWHTIGDATQNPRAYSQILLDGCNSGTVGAEIVVGDEIISGDRYIDDKNVLIGKIYNLPPPLEDRQFFAQLGGVGLYLSQDVTLTSASYTASVINVLNHGGEVIPAFTCQTLEIIDCNQQFLDKIAITQGVYAGKADCEIAEGVECVMLDFFVSAECGFATSWVPITPP